MRLRSSTLASNKRTAEAASLDDADAPRECDTAPDIPINLISQFILPFVQDRTTWNAVCGANKELHQAGTRMTPPWPQGKIRMLERVGALKFSPCGSFLASSDYFHPYLVHISDRRGRQTCLRGHTSGILILSFSNDGNYLVSAGSREYDSIRIWPTHPTTKLPQQSEKTLRGHRGVMTCLDFSPGDSNLLASGDTQGAIRFWNVEQEVCIHSFDLTFAFIESLSFPAHDEGQKCIFVTSTGLLIRTWWNDLSDIESDIVDMPGLDRDQPSAFSHCGSLLAAAAPGRDGYIVTLYDMINPTVVRTLTIPRNMSLGPYHGLLAFSPDGKTLVLRFNTDVIHICEVHNLKIMRLLQPDASAHTSNCAVAFDPSGQFLASVGGDESIRLWTL
jgi:WD40 repeat protein